MKGGKRQRGKGENRGLLNTRHCTCTKVGVRTELYKPVAAIALVGPSCQLHRKSHGARARGSHRRQSFPKKHMVLGRHRASPCPALPCPALPWILASEPSLSPYLRATARVQFPPAISQRDPCLFSNSIQGVYMIEYKCAHYQRNQTRNVKSGHAKNLKPSQGLGLSKGVCVARHRLGRAGAAGGGLGAPRGELGQRMWWWEAGKGKRYHGVMHLSRSEYRPCSLHFWR
jgi:hypothetical protein